MMWLPASLWDRSMTRPWQAGPAATGAT